MTVNKKWTESDVIADAIGERTYRDAAEWLNEKVPPDFRVTHASVFNWCAAAYKPTYLYLLAVTSSYPEEDPRHAMAKKLMEMRAKSINAPWAGAKS